MNFEKLCDDVFELDSKIRFVAIHDDDLHRIAGGMRNGTRSYLPDDITTLSVDGSFQRWRTRKEMSFWIGDPVYAFAEYGKIKRFTFYINSKKMLIISAETNIDNDKLVRGVKEKINENHG